MRPGFPSLALILALACSVMGAQIKKFSEPLGDKLDRALETSKLIQSGARPFHLRMEIKQTSGPSGNYNAVVEETWISQTLWTRTVSAEGLLQTIVVNKSGTHYVTSGDYFPNWLREFVTGITDPVPNAAEWDKLQPRINYVEMNGKVITDIIMRSEVMLGVPPVQQVNFADVTFQPDGLVRGSMVPGDTVGFGDYKPFGKLRVARSLAVSVYRHVELEGTVVALDEVTKPDLNLFSTPPSATDTDPLAHANVSSTVMMKLAVGTLHLNWPAAIPGNGMFTVWVNLDNTGKVREVGTLNSDLSGFAADMTAQFLGQQWIAPILSKVPVQASGPIVVAYPPAHP